MAKASDNVFPKLLFSSGSAPATPSAGQGKVYEKSSDKKLYFKNEDGTEYDLTASGGSGPLATRCTTTSTPTLNQGSAVTLTWETETFDDLASHSTSSNTSRFTAPSTGHYRFTFAYDAISGQSLYLQIKKNGTTTVAYSVFVSAAGGSNGQCIGQCTSGTIDLSSGDYLEAIVTLFRFGASGSSTRDSSLPQWAVFEAA